MARSAAPIWLGARSRFSGIPHRTARIGLVLLALLLLASLAALAAPAPPAVSGDANARSEDQHDIVLYEGIVAAVAHGERYYTATAEALRAGDYPLRPFFTFRPPALALIQASLPRPILIALQYLLVLTVALVWSRRLGEAIPRAAPRLVAMALVASGMMAFVQSDLTAFHEIWAGLLVALALGLRRPGRWVEAAAIGLIAALIRELAAPFLIAMAALAALEGERREAIGWSAAFALFLIALAAHAFAVAQVTSPLDPASPGWSGLLGFGFFVRAVTLSTALGVLPLLLAAPLVALALFGWLAWRDPLGLRMASLSCGYALIIALFGRVDNFYWALMVAPLFLAGLVFVPDGLRDLVAAALDRRRVRVQRISR